MSIFETFPADVAPVRSDICVPEPDADLLDTMQDREVWGSDTVEDCFLTIAGGSADPRPVASPTSKVDPLPVVPSILFNRQKPRPKPVGELAPSVKTGQVFETWTHRDSFAFAAEPKQTQPAPRRPVMADLLRPSDLVDELVFQRPAAPAKGNAVASTSPNQPRDGQAPVKPATRRKGAFFLPTG
jgi:hypothetical protein